MQSLTWSFNQGAESYYMLMTPQRQKSRKFITGVQELHVQIETHEKQTPPPDNELHALCVWEVVYMKLNDDLPCAREFFLLLKEFYIESFDS